MEPFIRFDSQAYIYSKLAFEGFSDIEIKIRLIQSIFRLTLLKIWWLNQLSEL